MNHHHTFSKKRRDNTLDRLSLRQPVLNKNDQDNKDKRTRLPDLATAMGSLKADGAPWEVAAARKRETLAASIPSEWRVPKDLLPPDSQEDVTGWPKTSGWFTPEELAITDSTAADLLPKLASGALKSVDVTKAFCKRAAAAHQLVLHPR